MHDAHLKIASPTFFKSQWAQVIFGLQYDSMPPLAILMLATTVSMLSQRFWWTIPTLMRTAPNYS